MSGFRAGDRVSFQFGSDPDCRYEGVLSDWEGYLQVRREDYTHKPAGGPEPGDWLVFLPHGEPAAMISNVHHTAPQEGSTMTTVPLREGDRITYRYGSDAPDEFRTSDPLTVKDISLYDPKNGLYITYSDDGRAIVDGIKDVTLVERYGERVVTATRDSHPGLLSAWHGAEWMVAYVDRPGTDSMLVCETNDESIISAPITDDLTERLGLPHELVGRRHFWLYRSTIKSAGIDLPTPRDDGATGDSEADAVDEVLQARIAELEAALEAEREERKREMLDYKAQVKAAARRAGEDNGWCIPGQNEILRDLGIDVTARKRITVGLKFDIIASTEEGDPGIGFTEQSIRINPERLKDVVSMDSDWSNVEFDHASYDFDVIDIEDEL